MNFGVRQFDVEFAGRNVEDDDVAIGDRSDRAAVRGFGRNVADHEAVCGAGKTAVGEQSDGIAEASADESGGDGEHLAHAGAAFGSFVADHDYIAGLDLIFLDGGESSFFVVENARWTAKMLVIVAGNFYDAAFGSEIAF